MQAASSPVPAEVPSSNERLLAGVAHVGAVFGPFLVVPIVIYFLQRDKSRFVTHHAVRAIKLYLGMLLVVVMGMITGMTLLVAIPSFMPPPLLMVMLMGLYTVVSLACLTYLVLAVIAAVRAYNGEMDTGINLLKSKLTRMSPMS